MSEADFSEVAVTDHISSEVFDESGESFIEPQVSPPLHSDIVSKPLQGLFSSVILPYVRVRGL